MRKLLLIGRFNDTTKKIHSGLLENYSVQLCSDNVSIATSMLQMYGADLILLNLEGLDEQHESLLELITRQYEAVPVIVVSDEKGKELFQTFLYGEQISVVETEDFSELQKEIAERLQQGEDEQKKKVLLVDDSPMMLRNMKQMLEMDYRISMVTSGDQAIAFLEKDIPDVIILDYEMPGCDGKETLQMIRNNEKTKDIPVVFLTGHGDAEHIKSVLDLNPAAYFLKPPKADKILEILGQLV